MDLVKVLAELRKELDVLNEAIVSLERLQHVKPRRGRPSQLAPELEAPPRDRQERLVSSSAGGRKSQRTS
jgi:hypothetical protein